MEAMCLASLFYGKYAVLPGGKTATVTELCRWVSGFAGCLFTAKVCVFVGKYDGFGGLVGCGDFVWGWVWVFCINRLYCLRKLCSR